MKTSRTVILTALLSLALVAGGHGVAQAHGSMMGPGGSGGWSGMGSGHMGGSGWGHMGSGGHMMDHEWDRPSEAPGSLFERDGEAYGPADPWKGEHPVTRGQVRRVMEYRLADNPYVRIGAITENGDSFEVSIVTRKGGELVDRLEVEKRTGRTFPLRD